MDVRNAGVEWIIRLPCNAAISNIHAGQSNSQYARMTEKKLNDQQVAALDFCG
jgi:hypothetical protein